MAENRIRLGPFAQKLLAKHGPKGAVPNGKVLDDLLTKAFADGKMLDPGLAGDISERLDALPEWEACRDNLLAYIFGALDGHGDESLESFEKLNKRVDGLNVNVMTAVKNTEALGRKIDDLNEQIKALREECKDRDPF